MASVTDARRLDRRLLIGPALVVLGLVLLKVSDVLLYIGPLDRAAFGWLIPVPMLLLAPGTIGVAARRSGPTAARRVALVTGLILGLAVGSAWFASSTQIGCDPQPDLTSVGVAGAVVAGAAMLVAWGLLFPGVTCVPAGGSTG
jgi:hypothetical protein